MLNLVKFVLFLLYTYYDYGESSHGSSYSRSVFVFLLLIYVNLLTIVGLLDIEPSQALPWFGPNDTKGIQYLKLALLYFIPGFFVVRLFVKKEEIKESKYEDRTISRGYIFLVSYGILSAVAFVIVALSLKN